MAHLTPEQFVDLAEGTQPESSLPHLAACEDCRSELATLRAMMSDAVVNDAGNVPEPSPLFWNHLSTRVRGAVAQDSSHHASWLDWLSQPRVLMPSLTGALAILIGVVLLQRSPAEPRVNPIPSTPLPLASNATVPAITPSLPPLAPLGAADDPQLRIVTGVADATAWDEMMDEVAISNSGSGDAVAATLTADERRELQRLLTEEIAQPSALEKRS